MPLSPPIEVFGGQAAALQVADHFHRGKQILGRFERSGLVGFKVVTRGRWLRVKVALALDETSFPGWHLDVRGQAARLPQRLIQVRAQGRLRQCVLLKGGPGIKSGQAVFDLMPEEVPDDGLVCVELLDIAEGRGVSPEVRAALAESVMEGGTAGLRVDSVAFEEVPEPRAVQQGEELDAARCELLSLISSGGLANLNRRGGRTIRSGLFVVNPVPLGVFGSGGRLTVRLGSRADLSTGRPATARDRALMRRALRRVGGEARRSAARHPRGPVHGGAHRGADHERAGRRPEPAHPVHDRQHAGARPARPADLADARPGRLPAGRHTDPRLSRLDALTSRGCRRAGRAAAAGARTAPGRRSPPARPARRRQPPEQLGVLGQQRLRDEDVPDQVVGLVAGAPRVGAQPGTSVSTSVCSGPSDLGRPPPWWSPTGPRRAAASCR